VASKTIFYCAARRDRKAFLSVILQEHAFPMRVFLRVGARPIIRLANGAHRATNRSQRRPREPVRERATLLYPPRST
jgi:hypothetical protein